MSKVHHVIYVPGLSDQRKAYDFLINGWKIYGIVPHVYKPNWYDGRNFKPKLKGLITFVNKLLEKGNTVSLVGGSAGGSMVLNTLIEQPKINAVVNLCGRLRAGKDVFPSLELASKNSLAFKESVLLFESREPKMDAKLRKKVLNLIPLWDEVVPKPTVPLRGATNKTLPSVEHMFSGFMGMTFLSPMVMKFIKDKSNDGNVFELKDGRKLGYIEYGDPRGKPLYFFHGWPGSRFAGKEVDETGKKLGVRIISTDRPGIGLSDFKKNRRLLDWPDDIVELANYLKIKKFSLMGVSGGGPYVAVCAYKIPERIIKAGIVVGLAPVTKKNLEGMASQGKLGWANYHKFPWLRTLSVLNSEILFKYLPFLGNLLAFPTKQDHLAYVEAVKNKAGEESSVKEAFKQGIKGAVDELRVYTDDWGFKVKDIKTKVYLWYGAKDKCVSLNMARYYKSQIKGSKLFIDKNGGHLARYKFEGRILKTLVN